MAATVLGNALTTRVAAKNSPRIRENSDGTEIVYVYTQKQGTAVGITLGAANGATGYTDTYLKEIVRSPAPGGGYETLELVYAPAVSGGGGVTPPVGTIIYEADANMMDFPIQEHPDFENPSSPPSVYDDAGNLVTPSVNGSLKPGLTSYQVPCPTYTRTEILDAFTFSEANIIAAVGTRHAPTGMTSPTANKWLKTRLSVRKNGKVIEKAETWQYAGPGTRVWDDDIYGATA